MLAHSNPALTIPQLVSPMIVALAFIAACSIFKEPSRRNFSAIVVAGAGAGYLIDLCINNAIMGVREGNTYAQTEGERRSVRRPAQASFGIAGFRPLSERSGS